MLRSQNPSPDKTSNSPILYIVVIVATIIFTTITIILIIFISRRCQGQQRDDAMSDEKPYLSYPLIDIASGISRGPQMHDGGFGVASEPLNMSSSNMISQLWNARQPLGTFHDSDQPISNGYNTVDFRWFQLISHFLQKKNVLLTRGNKNQLLAFFSVRKPEKWLPEKLILSHSILRNTDRRS